MKRNSLRKRHGSQGPPLWAHIILAGAVFRHEYLSPKGSGAFPEVIAAINAARAAAGLGPPAVDVQPDLTD